MKKAMRRPQAELEAEQSEIIAPGSQTFKRGGDVLIECDSSGGCGEHCLKQIADPLQMSRALRSGRQNYQMTGQKSQYVPLGRKFAPGKTAYQPEKIS
jgi:hypothetical protein